MNVSLTTERPEKLITGAGMETADTLPTKVCVTVLSRGVKRTTRLVIGTQSCNALVTSSLRLDLSEQSFCWRNDIVLCAIQYRRFERDQDLSGPRIPSSHFSRSHACQPYLSLNLTNFDQCHSGNGTAAGAFLKIMSKEILQNGSKAILEFSTVQESLARSSFHIKNLRGNPIESNGAQALYEALMVNSTLTTLDLEDNSIGDNGAQALSEALKANSTLTTLDLSRNPIESNGAQALSEALTANSTLTTLDLSRNPIESNGAQALSEALTANSTLTTLSLGDTSIGDRRYLRHSGPTRL
ncbi:hypothetical protein KI688_005981 [Linnemannia hyalina]|uniref:RNI-like protein n=1 Tax=Linnemannia hyalina TaxID=64524 RepID=A0A9P7Y2J1_9FUNG|nr:hypothetical protein KI688_005981 [Linnemannia hyalina]